MTVKKKLDVKSILMGYSAPKGMSVPQIIAHLAHTMSVRMPLQAIPWAWVAKICNNRPKLPPEDGREVELIKARLGRARSIAREQYKQDIRSIPGFGIRATIDSSDTARGTYIQAVRRVRATTTRAQEIADIINSKEIPERDLREFVDSTKQGLRISHSKVLPLLEPKQPLNDEASKDKK